MRTIRPLSLSLLLAVGCASSSVTDARRAPSDEAAPASVADTEVADRSTAAGGAVRVDTPASSDPASPRVERLRPAADGWEAVVALDTDGVGVWTVVGADVSDVWGGDEVVALDDEGLCWLLVPYSGRWTPMPSVHDGKWLGALAIADLDPAHPGREILTGGLRGNLYLVSPHPQGGFDARVLAYFPGEEIHTAVVGEFDAQRGGLEALVFTSPGAVYLLAGDESRPLGATVGRVRDALLLPGASADGALTLLAVSRSGHLDAWTIAGGEIRGRRTLHQVESGLGRLTRDAATGLVYTGTDDGQVLRVRIAEGAKSAQVDTIHSGALGLRGIAAADFDGSGREQVAICGYDGKVHLLTADGAGGFDDLVLYDDEAKLHWLGLAELDGRNAGPELLCSGYGGRVVMLRRTAR